MFYCVMKSTGSKCGILGTDVSYHSNGKRTSRLGVGSNFPPPTCYSVVTEIQTVSEVCLVIF